MNKQKHKWTESDETICCYEYLKYSLMNNCLKDYDEILENLSNLLPDINRNSIKMKLQNIKFLCESHNVPDFVSLKPLCNVSIKNCNVFRSLIELPEIKELILLRKADLTKNKI